VIDRRKFLYFVAGLPLVAADVSFAQAYPQRPITLIVPYAPGGATDIIGRVIATEISNTLGQRMIVDNRAGAGGSVGAQAATRAPADGYTLMLGALTSHSINMTFQAKPGFDLKKDFAPVGLAGNVGLALVVHPSVPAKTVSELIALIKANPQDYSCATSGQGSPQHLSAELFNLKAGLKMPLVPYRGSGPAMTDMVGGQVKIMFDTIPAVLQYVKAGSLKAIATTGREPSSFMPEVPTVIAQGLDGFEVSSWFGMLAPAETPKAIIDQLNAEMNKALQSVKVKEALALQGVDPKPSTPAEASKLIETEIAKWGDLIKATGIKPE